MTWFVLLACSGHYQPKVDTSPDSEPIVNTDDQDGDGYSAGDDCNDGDAAINPGMPEFCDGVDNDCDSAVDEADAMDAGTVYADSDGDSFGDPALPSVACPGAGLVADNTDCNDSDGTIYPGAAEVCDLIDNDCDGVVDNSGDAVTMYPDRDGDGFGDTLEPTGICGGSAGYVMDGTDCNDADIQSFPGAPEQCDGLDNDCDLSVDEDGICPEDTGDSGDSGGDSGGDSSVDTGDSSVDTGDSSVDDTGVIDTGDSSVIDTGDSSVDTGDSGDTGDSSVDTGDSGGAVSRDGVWSGTLELVVDVPTYGFSDTCSAPLDITITTANATPIVGSFSCTFLGDLAFLGTQNGTMDGTIAEPNASGSVTWWIFSDTWSGSFPTSDTLEGSFSGSTTYLNAQADYQGSFTVTLQ